MIDGSFDVNALDELFEGLKPTLSTKEAAQLMGVSVTTIQNMITNPESSDPLPAYKLGKVWVILRDDFKQWLLRRRNTIID